MKILDTDSIYEKAFKIFNEFEILQSCSITGLVEMPDRKMASQGELVLEEIRKMDIMQNVTIPKDGRQRRRRKSLPETIGGYVAHKIFKYKKIVLEDDVKVDIWRIQ